MEDTPGLNTNSAIEGTDVTALLIAYERACNRQSNVTCGTLVIFVPTVLVISALSLRSNALESLAALLLVGAVAIPFSLAAIWAPGLNRLVREIAVTNDVRAL